MEQSDLLFSYTPSDLPISLYIRHMVVSHTIYLSYQAIYLFLERNHYRLRAEDTPIIILLKFMLEAITRFGCMYVLLALWETLGCLDMTGLTITFLLIVWRRCFWFCRTVSSMEHIVYINCYV